MAATTDRVLEALGTVIDSDLGGDIVSLGLVKNVRVDGTRVGFEVELPIPVFPAKALLREECEKRVRAIAGVEDVEVRVTSSIRGRSIADRDVIRGVKNTIAVASGKGGVGKSTTAVNLALALSEAGAAVGLMDADIYGPSIPIMFALNRQPMITPERKIIPLEKHGLRLLSMGFLTGDDSPVIWRGPMVHGIIKQFLSDVDWGALDYLVIDLPPGTGDAQLTLTQSAPLSGAVIVTTPNDVALIDARKGLMMFEKVSVPVLGIIENMSYFICTGCGARHEIFDSGGGRSTAEQLGVPFLAEIPIDVAVRVGGDCGMPVVVGEPESPITDTYRALAAAIAIRLAAEALAEEEKGDFRIIN